MNDYRNRVRIVLAVIILAIEVICLHRLRGRRGDRRWPSLLRLLIPERAQLVGAWLLWGVHRVRLALELERKEGVRAAKK